ncbi:hypothetical protein [Kitasatospora sp. NPDC091207]|uniref:hypothetical protein n=1 Tax=Kitasatospora sp. NPDC091207 TaxID=3364083 RepID=UPI0038186DB5
MRRTTRLVVTLALAALAAGCAGQGASAPAEPTGPRPYLADADADGYLTYDPRTQALAGYTRDGTRRWQRESIDPYEVHCVLTCPDAVISLRPKDPGEAGASGTPTAAEAGAPAADSTGTPGVLWIAGTAATPAGGADTKIHWAASREDWIGSTPTELLISNRGNITRTPLKNSASALFRLSPDGSSAMFSTPAGATPESGWSGQSLEIGKDGPKLGRAIASIPGPIGCWSPDGTRMVTLGKNPSVVSASDGAPETGLSAEFASECSSGPSGITVGEYRPGLDGNTGQVTLFDGSSFRRTSTSNRLTDAAGFKSAGPCVTFTQHGRVGFMNPADGSVKSSKIQGIDTWKVGTGELWALRPDGRAELVPVGPKNCPPAG